jgi:leucyl/phenylalanyl-tRNA---protein transferase
MLCKRLTIAGSALPLEGKGTERLNESMASRESAFIDITPEVLLKAYSCGIFPMAESADDPALYWIEPERRGIIPLDRFHLAGRLARTVRSTPFTVVVDRNFDAVIEGCAQPQPARSRTWINSRIRTLYRKLYERGDCHTVEVYDGESLIGGLYGVSLGRAFFGESMFHRARDASKIALVHLVARLKAGGYRLLDTQFVTEHLRSFGATEVSRPIYHKLLDAALVGEADFAALPVDQPISGETVLARLAQS